MNDNFEDDLYGRLKSLLKRPIVITLIVFLTAAALLLFGFKAADIFSENKKNDQNTVDVSSFSTGIPEINTVININGSFRDISEFQENPFAFIEESDSYSRTARIVQIFNEESNGVKTTISRFSDSIKAESDSNILIYNSGKLYVDYGSKKTEFETDETVFYEIAGITSLDMIRKMHTDSQQYDTHLSLSEDYQVLTAEIMDNVSGIKMVFEINVESGLVLTERFYYQEILYRYVVTESLSKEFTADHGYFSLP